MAQRIFSILVVWLLLLGEEILAQDATAQSYTQNPSFSIEWNNLGYFPRYRKSPFSFPHKKMIKNLSASHFGFSPDFVVRNFSFFCKNEYEFEKATGLALRVRLGSLDYVNRLERGHE